jgi:DNA repair protein RadA/Sms
VAKTSIPYRCRACGAESPKWAGRCPACAEWNTIAEVPAAGAGRWGGERLDVPTPIGAVGSAEHPARPTGLAEVDRVLGGGLVPGSVTLLGGAPGIGKSTLLLQVASSLARRGATVLVVTAEESKHQVRRRADRLGAVEPGLLLVADHALPHLVTHLDEVAPDVVVVDSIQAVHDPSLPSPPGSVAQVRECAAHLVREAKARHTAVVLVGHVTKEGTLAGPRVLEHLVDSVLAFEGDRHHALRMLRAVKHRFGPTDQLGLFEMTGSGLVAVEDPSRLFLADRRPGQVGSVVVPTVDGHRPLLVEVQALTSRSSLATPRRSAEGVDAGRLAVVLAVLDQRVRVPTTDVDVFALAVGGVALREPAVDVALALAVVSSRTDHPLPADLVAVGEVGLGGELRQVAQIERRLAEAARLGFGRAVVPWSVETAPSGLVLLRARTLGEAVGLAGLPFP